MSNQPPAILVVDDEERFLNFVVQALQKLGYPAIASKDEDSAVKVAETTPSLQLLLCDVRLKLGSGPALVRRALKSRPELKVVFMSGSSQNAAFRRTDPFLEKPFTLEQLKHTIEDVITRVRYPERRRVTAG